MQSVAITISSWGIKIWIVGGLTMDLFGWLKDWQAGLRGQWVNGLSAPCLRRDADLLSWSLLCLASAQRWVNDFLLWKVSGVCLKALEMLHVTHKFVVGHRECVDRSCQSASFSSSWLVDYLLAGLFPSCLALKDTTLYQCVSLNAGALRMHIWYCKCDSA